MNSNVEQVRFSAEFDLVEFLKENNYIEEHVYESAMIDRKHSFLFESRGADDPYVQGGVPFTHFKNIWNDFSTYPTNEDVHDALRPEKSQLPKASKNAWLNRTIAHWKVHLKGPDTDRSLKGIGIPEGKEIKGDDTKERDKLVEKYLSKKATDLADDVDPEDSVDPGQQGKKSQTGNVEKASDLIPGELYADMTRIPKRQWGGWWRKLVQHKTSVEPPKQAITSLRKWTRHFILGYQLEENLSYEIWYNSQDGTFSVHDRWGNPVRGGTKIPVMKDALNLLFQNVAQFAPSDVDFFKQPSNELKRVNLGLEKEGQAAERAAEQEAKEMRQDKAKQFTAFDFSEEAQKKKAQQSRRRNSSTPDKKDGKFNKEKEEDYDERGKKSREETETDAGEENNISKKNAKKYKRAQEKMKNVKDNLRKRAEAAERRERSKTTDDPADSQGTNTGSSVAAQSPQGEYIPSEQGESEKEDFKAKPYIVIDGTEVSNPTAIANAVKQAASNPNVDLDDIRFKNMPKKLIDDLRDYYEVSKEISTEVAGKPKGLPSSLDKSKEEKRREAEAKQASQGQQKKKGENKDNPDNIDLDQYFNDEGNVSLEDEFGMGLDDDLGGGMGDDPFESLKENSTEQTDAEDGVNLGDAEENPLYSKQNNQRVKEVRQQAERSQYTRQMVNNMFVEGLIKEYYQTRSRQYKSVLEKVTDWFKMFRGRNERIQVPTNIVSRKQRIKGFFSGAQARSDFIVGFSIKDKVNYEVWYVQEISSNGKEQIASFYVYDVTAEKIIKSNIPYYRNALSVVMTKIKS